jgi:hypothetical protein
MSTIMGNKDIVVWFDVEQPSLGRNLTKFVFTTPTQSEGMQQIEEQGTVIHLPIVSCSQKVNIQLMRGTRKLQMVCHIIFLIRVILNKFGKRYLESLIPTPHVMPKYNFGAVTHFKSRMTRELSLAPPYIFPKSHIICPMDLIWTPPTPHTTMFRINNHPP